MKSKDNKSNNVIPLVVPRTGIEPVRPFRNPRILSSITTPPNISENGIFPDKTRVYDGFPKNGDTGGNGPNSGHFCGARGKNAGKNRGGSK